MYLGITASSTKSHYEFTLLSPIELLSTLGNHYPDNPLIRLAVSVSVYKDTPKETLRDKCSLGFSRNS
jgi:hypothetical protein